VDEAKEHAQLACRAASSARAAAPALPAALRARVACAGLTHANDLDDAARALHAAPRSPENELRLADAQLTAPTPELDAAETALTELATSMPSLIRAQVLLARTHLLQKHVAAARNELAAILVTEPDHESARALLEANPEEPAEPVRVDPPPPEPAAVAVVPAPGPAKVEPEAVRAEPAAVVAKPPEPAKPVDADVLIEQGNKLLSKSKMKALQLFDQALVLKPNHAEALYGRGVALFDLGRVDDAIVALNRSLSASPRFSDAMLVLADAYKLNGAKADARKWYEQYLELAGDSTEAAAARRSLDELK
jgi:tetratricopeptide (TPR) repeat protein